MSRAADHTIVSFLDFVSSTRRIAALYVFNFFFCTFVYMTAEHVSLLDALWWATQTWFTVGYGDHIPQSVLGKLFTMYTIISSHILIVLITANFVIKLSRYRNKRHAHRHNFCTKHRRILAQTVECEDCNSPLTFF